MDQIKDILLKNSIYENETSETNHIIKRLMNCAIDPGIGDTQFNVEYKIVYDKIPKELTHGNIVAISDYFKKEEKLDFFKKIFQINMILDLTSPHYFSFKEPHLSECIKKFNFGFTIPSMEVEENLNEIINYDFVKKIGMEEYSFRLSKHITFRIIGYLKELELRITPWEKISVTMLPTSNLINSLRKKYIYGFLYNNNFIPKLEEDFLKFC